MPEYKRVNFTQAFPILGEQRSALDATNHKVRITRDGDRVLIESLAESRLELYEIPANLCVLVRDLPKKEKAK